MKISFAQLVGMLILLSLAFACDTEDPVDNDPVVDAKKQEFCDAIMNRDLDYLTIEFEDLCADLLPEAIDADPLGHEANLTELIQRLNDMNCLTASLGCYACIETFPLISEININIKDGDIVFEYVIDFQTPGDGVLVFAGLH